MNSAARAVFLDRDGVINRPAPAGLYITSTDEFILLPGVGEAIFRLNQSGLKVFVVTNQRCIGLGLVAAEIVEQVHAGLQQTVREYGGWIDHIYVCPHDYGDACLCRKPKPGMLRQAASDYALDLPGCWMVGDSESDMTAGRAAGCRTVLVGGAAGLRADYDAADLREATELILKK